MKERPILFSGPMVRAILDGTKTVTRRIVDPGAKHGGGLVNVRGKTFDMRQTRHAEAALALCPYGSAGDRLWVRETWQKRGEVVLYRADTIADGWRPSIFMPRALSRITLEIVSVCAERLQDIADTDIVAEGVNRETLDALLSAREQRELEEEEEVNGTLAPRGCWAMGWDAINGKRAPWSSNPWVWRVEFKRTEPAGGR